MKRPSLLLALLLPLAVLRAEDQSVDYTISAVTVFNDRAEVTRTAQVDIAPGSHRLRFEDLPGGVDADTLQVKGTGDFVINDIRLDTVYLKEDADPAWGKLYAERDALKTRVRAEEKALERNQQLRRSLDAVVKRLTAPPVEGETTSMDPAQWSAMLDFQSQRLASLDEDTLQREQDIRDLQESITELEKKINQFNARRQRTRTDALVVVEAESPVKAVLDVSYQVRGPSWSPSYQVRADSERDTVSIVYRANVRQSTGEDWNDVALSLSTAQPQVGGREPSLSPWRIYSGDEVRPEPMAKPALMKQQLQVNNLMTAELASDLVGAASRARVAQAQVQAGLTASVFAVPAKVTIHADNQPVIATIQQFESPAHYRHTAVPKLSPHVYLKAKIENVTDAQLLPGPGSVFIDGNFVGQAPLELTAPGEQFWVYLGVDPAVQVKRKELEGEKGTSGLFNKTVRVVRAYEFEIANERREAIDMVLWDQFPMAEDEDIDITLIEPKYKEKTDALAVTEEKFIEWQFDIPAGGKKTVPFSYSVEYPKDTQVYGL